jgi:hypothetical protein
MDIFAHALWTAAGARAGNVALEKKHKPLIRLWWAAFWGVFPDLFAFVLPMLLAIPMLIRDGFVFGPPSADGLPHELYNYSHSLVIWAAVFIIVWIVSKRPRFVLFGWALHILIDMPSHAASFYPTPFLFPLSDYKFLHGISWSNTWYMIINYTALIGVYAYILIRNYKKKRAAKEAADYLASK